MGVILPCFSGVLDMLLSMAANSLLEDIIEPVVTTEVVVVRKLSLPEPL